jgi:hypothetical protein
LSCTWEHGDVFVDLRVSARIRALPFPRTTARKASLFNGGVKGGTGWNLLRPIPRPRIRERVKNLKVLRIALLCVAAYAPSSANAQVNPVTNEYRVTVFPYHNIRGKLTGFGYLGYVNNPQSDYATYYLGWPGINYTYKPWLQIWAGSMYIYTDNFHKGDKLELRPFVGAKVFLPNKRKMNLYNFTRYEYRGIKDKATADWSVIHRIRTRFGAEIPLTSPARAWKPKTFYAIADAEPFFRFDKKALDPVRLRAGLAYIPNDRVRFEFIYHAQYGRTNADDPLAYTQNIFRLNIKIALNKGILDRAQNPGLDD